MIEPFSLTPYLSPRPWGSLDLTPWYTERPPEPIGEAWLTGQDCKIESGEHAGSTLGELVAEHPAAILGAEAERLQEKSFPLLLKLLFPHDKLSVQVHPDDEMAAAAAGEPRGKTECWYVLSARSEAAIALGLHPGTTRETIREAVAHQTLEQLLDWIPVYTGEMIYVDAGTVHAIGPGVVLLETQQYSDLTYRLYDYGRPRELHLDLALRALKLKTEAGKVLPVHRAGYDQLIRKPYFIVERHQLWDGEERQMKNETATVHSWVALSGSAAVAAPGAPAVELVPGRAVVVPAEHASYSLIAREAFVGVRAIPPGTETGRM